MRAMLANEVEQAADLESIPTEVAVFPSAVRPLTLDNLIGFVEQSSYLYDASNPLFASSRVRLARWHEIGAFFGTTGEAVVRHWLKAVARYKYILKKLLMAKLCGKPVQAPGSWFDRVGSIIGATFEEAMAQLDPEEGLEDCLHRLLLPSRSLLQDTDINYSGYVNEDEVAEGRGRKRGLENDEDPEEDYGTV